MDEMDVPSVATVSGRTGQHRNFSDCLHAINVAVSWGSSVILVLGSFVVTPAVLGALGKDHYGIWLLITSYIGQMRILDLGVTSGCMKFSGDYFERGATKELRQVFNTSIVIFGTAAMLVVAITGAMAVLLPSIYPDKLANAQAIIVTLGLSLAIDFLCRPFSASLRGRSYFFVYDSIEIVTYLIFKLGFVLYLCHAAGFSLWTLALLTLLESCVRNGSVVVSALRICDWTRTISPRLLDFDILGKLASFSGIVLLISIADLFRFQIDAAVIAKYVPSMGEVTTYGIGFKLVGMAGASIGVIGSVLVPRFSGLFARGAHGEMLELLRKANLATGILTVFTLVNIAVFGSEFLRLWIGAPWVAASYIVALIAIPGYFMDLLQGPAGAVLTGAGKLRWITWLTIAEAACNVVLSLLFVKPLGIFGVCLGTAIPMFFFRGFAFPWILKKELDIPMAATFRMHARPLLIGGVYALCILCFAFFHYSGFTELFMACLVSTMIYGILLWMWLPEARAVAATLAAKIPAR